MCSIQALKEAVNRLQSGSQEEMVDRRLVNKLLVRLPGVFTDEVLSLHMPMQVTYLDRKNNDDVLELMSRLLVSCSLLRCRQFSHTIAAGL
jgi:hypothetical protein